MDVDPAEIVAPQPDMLDKQRESDLRRCGIEWALTGAEHGHDARCHSATWSTAVAGVEVDTRCAQEHRHHRAHEWWQRAALGGVE